MGSAEPIAQALHRAPRSAKLSDRGIVEGAHDGAPEQDGSSLAAHRRHVESAPEGRFSRKVRETLHALELKCNALKREHRIRLDVDLAREFLEIEVLACCVAPNDCHIVQCISSARGV